MVVRANLIRPKVGDIQSLGHVAFRDLDDDTLEPKAKLRFDRAAYGTWGNTRSTVSGLHQDAMIDHLSRKAHTSERFIKPLEN